MLYICCAYIVLSQTRIPVEHHRCHLYILFFTKFYSSHFYTKLCQFTFNQKCYSFIQVFFWGIFYLWSPDELLILIWITLSYIRYLEESVICSLNASFSILCLLFQFTKHKNCWVFKKFLFVNVLRFFLFHRQLRIQKKNFHKTNPLC